jgi:hypothetical protein
MLQCKLKYLKALLLHLKLLLLLQKVDLQLLLVLVLLHLQVSLHNLLQICLAVAVLT